MRKFLSLILSVLFLAGSVPVPAIAETELSVVYTEASESEDEAEILSLEPIPEPDAQEPSQETDTASAEQAGSSEQVDTADDDKSEPSAPASRPAAEDAPAEAEEDGSAPDTGSTPAALADPEPDTVENEEEDRKNDRIEADPEDAPADVPEAEEAAPSGEPVKENIPSIEPITEAAEPVEETPLTDMAAFYSVTCESNAHGVLEADKKEAEAGATVSVHFAPDFGHILSLLTFNGEDVTARVDSCVFSFTMPEEDVLLSAEFVEDPALRAFGRCGENVLWSLNTEGCLLLTGAGPMADHDTASPFYAYRDEILTVSVENGITSIGSSAFRDCALLSAVALPDSLQRIGANAFSGCAALEELCLPAGILSIDESAFTDSGLSSLSCRDSASPKEEEQPDVPAEDSDALFTEAAELYEAAYILSPDQQISLTTDPEGLKDALVWKSETPSVCTFDNGIITALSAGTGYIYGEGTFAGKAMTARIRIDVTQSAQAADDILSVSLAEKSISVSIFKTSHPRFEVLLERNAPALLSEGSPSDSGVLLRAAQFTDAAVKQLFVLRVIDDRTLELIPTAAALSDPDTLLSSYSSPIALSLADESEDRVTEEMTINVDKTVPSIEAKPLTLNSYFEGDSVSPDFTGGNVTAFEVVSLPEWLSVNGNAFRIRQGKAGISATGTVEVLCTVSGWQFRPTVSFTVKAVCAAPVLKLENSSVTLNPGTVDRVTVRYSVQYPAGFDADHAVTLGRVTEVTGTKETVSAFGKPVNAVLSSSARSLTLSSAATDGNAHSYRVYIHIGGKESGHITVNTVSADAAKKLAVAVSGYIDTGFPNSEISLKITPACFHGLGLGESYSLRILQTKKGTTTKDVTSLFRVTEGERGVFTLKERTRGSLLKKYTYTLEINADLSGNGKADASASLKLSVKHTPEKKAKPSVSIKASGKIDPLRAGTKIKLAMKLKNCFSFTPSAENLHFYRISGTTAVPLTDVPFEITKSGNSFILSQKPGAKLPSGTYSVQFTGMINGRYTASKRVKLSVKQGKVKLSSTKAQGTLLLNSTDTFTFRIGLKDSSLRGIRAVRINSSLFSLTALANGNYALSWRDSSVLSSAMRPRSGSSKTFTLSVFAEGNETSKPNAKFKLKLKFKDGRRVSERIVASAKSYLGTPYSKYDCSQFTQLVIHPFDSGIIAGAHLQWRHVRSSSHWTYSAYTDGPIPAGAIVFFSAEGTCHCGRPGEIHHVAISVGSGLMIDSTDRPDINCVNQRSLYSRLTYKGEEMHIAGYAMYND